MSGPIIAARQLARRYGGRWALAGMDLEVQAGQTLLVCGANGSGKTTLTRVLGTALRPSSGSLSLFGAPAGDTSRARLSLLSHADGHYDDLTASENLRLAASLCAGGNAAGRNADVLAILAQLGLAERADDLVRTFSAGMRKRLAFGRVLVKDADLILLDEPYAALDPDGARLVDTLVRGWRARGKTILLSTHQVERAAALSDDAVVLDGGRVRWSGPAAMAHVAAGGAG